jgi:uncharacterized protein (TIGR03905 family)
MIREFTYLPLNVCSRKMVFKYDSDTNTLIEFTVIGGCNGNLKGIKALIEGLKLEDIATKLEGIRCGYRNTSCPDQISIAVKKLLNQ